MDFGRCDRLLRSVAQRHVRERLADLERRDTGIGALVLAGAPDVRVAVREDGQFLNRVVTRLAPAGWQVPARGVAYGAQWPDPAGDPSTRLTFAVLCRP